MKHFRTTPIALAEGNGVEQISNQVQLMRTCTFFHNQYGKVEITRQLFDEMIRNHKNNARGIEVMIDYSHDSEKEAAGWIKDLSVREVALSEVDPITNESKIEHQLWADVDWTPKGTKTLSDKEFAYLSADFDPDYKDNENPTQSLGAVLLGAGLTNRPVIKRMNPAIQLSEFSETNIKENKMTLEEIQKLLDAKTLKLSETEQELGDAKKELSDSEVKLAQIDSLMKDLGVSTVEELMSKIQAMSKDNVELAEEKEKNEKESKLNVLLSEGKISQAQKEIAIKLEKTAFDSYFSLAEMNEKVVKLDESGNNKTPTEEDTITVDGVEDKVLELAEAKVEADKGLEMTDAISLVLSEDKELASKYYKLGEQ